MKKMIEFEGLGEVVKSEIKALEDKLKADLGQSLQHFEKDIKDLIADEIVKRYYGQKGEIIYNLRKDSDITEACKLLSDKERYTSILTPQKKE